MRRVAIVGGGVAGLMAAWELARLGYEVDLYDASGELGGLASAFDFEGTRIERFYHFICQSDQTLIETCDRLGLGDRLRWKQTRTAFFYEGRHYPFGSSVDLARFTPLSLTDKLRFGVNVLYSRRFRHWPRLEDQPARDWLIERIGRRAYDVIWDPLLRVKFGAYHGQISAAWMWHRIHRVATSRRSLFHRERFGCLEGGSDTLIHALEAQATGAGARIHRRAAVQAIRAEKGRVTGLVVDSGQGRETVPHDVVICAVPLPVFGRLAPDDRPEYLERIASIRFIGVVCMILRLREAVSPNFWLNVHDRRISFNGIIEYSNLYGREAYGGRSILYVPYYLDPSLPRYRFADDELFDEYLEALRLIQPRFSRSWVESWRVFRAPYAQPICHTGFSAVVPPFETPWEGCYLVESTQLYPADRVISGTLRLAQDVVLRILDRDGRAADAGIRRRAPEEIPA